MKKLQVIEVKITVWLVELYPSLGFSRLAIDLVKPVKQVSIKRVFPGGRLVGWKIITNSALNLKKRQVLVGW